MQTQKKKKEAARKSNPPPSSHLLFLSPSQPEADPIRLGPGIDGARETLIRLRAAKSEEEEKQKSVGKSR